MAKGIMVKQIIEQHPDLVGQYKTLFDRNIDVEVTKAMKKCIKKMVLKDGHKDAVPLIEPIYDKQILGVCFLEAEVWALTDCVKGSKVQKIKDIINIFNEFEDFGLCKVELWALSRAIQETDIEYKATKNLLKAATVELFGDIVKDHPEVEGFQELYDQTLALLGSNEDGSAT